ncbi:MAG: hypothetical protein WB679_25450 [Terracidiphilus sp.]
MARFAFSITYSAFVAETIPNEEVALANTEHLIHKHVAGSETFSRASAVFPGLGVPI